MILAPTTLILLLVVFACDNYLWNRGRHLYSVVLGIDSEGDDSFEDYRVYANNAKDAKFKAAKKYSRNNEIDIVYVDVVVVERIKD